MKALDTSRRLRVVLIAGTLAANVFVGGLLTDMLATTKNRLDSDVRTAAENVALLLDIAVTEIVSKVDLALRATVEELESELLRNGRPDDRAVAAFLAQRQAWFAGLPLTLRVIDAAGTARYCSGCTGVDGSFANRDFFVASRNGEQSGLIVGAVSIDDRTVSFSRRYGLAGQRFAGVVSATIPIDGLGQVFSKVNLGPRGTALLRDASLALILRAPPGTDSSQGAGTRTYSRELAEIVASGDTARTYHTAQSGDGIERTLAYRRLSIVPFHVVAGMATEDYLADWRERITQAMVLAAFFLIASTGLAWMLWRAYVRTETADERYRSLLHNASDGVHILDPQHNVIEVSDAFCKMLGYTRAEMIGMNVRKWDIRLAGDPPEDFVVPIEGTPGIATFETRIRRKDGHTLDAEMTVRALKIGGQGMFIASARDISERKRAVQALIDREAQFRRFFLDNGSVMLLVHPSSGEISSANQAALDYYGHARERLIGMRIEDINAGSSEDLAYQRGRALRQERTYFNARHRLASGEERDVEVYASPIAIDDTTTLLCIVHDVSRRRAAEARSRRLSNLYAALSQCSQAIVHCPSETELFPEVCRCVVEYGFAKTAWIGFVNVATRRVEPVACDGSELSLEFLSQIPMSVDADDPYGRGLTGTAIRTNRPQWTQDYLHDPVTAPWHEYGRIAGWKSSATLPLCRGGVPVGCMVIYSDTPGAFDDDARKLLFEMAANISFALDNFAREAERQRSQAALLASEGRYRLAFQTSLDAISITRLKDGVYVDVNEGFVAMSGYALDEVIGLSTSGLNVWAESDKRQMLFDQLREASKCRNVEAQFRKKNGDLVWGLMSASLVELDGEPCILAMTRDITDIKLAEDEIRKLAFYDSLTQLANRRLLNDVLRLAVEAAGRTRHKCALLFVDLDNFNLLNDSGGHAMGDLLLQEVGRRLARAVREGDRVARFGGDEFVVLLERLSERHDEAASQAEAVGEAILAGIREPYLLAGREHRGTASIGITLFGGQNESADALLAQADIAMYQAKESGRNTLRFFSPDLQAAIQARTEMEADLHRAIAQGQFLLHYQPQVNHDGLVGAEVLIRWMHPERGLMAPGRFIPLAEQSGLILPIGQWVLETACQQLAAWCARQETAGLALAVNVSALQFRQPDFVEQTLATLERTGANPHHLKLEIVESMLMDNVDDVIEKMTALRCRGVRFSLDDFGTGYSSLSYLKRLPLDQLKIDWSFVKDVLTDANDAAIAQTIVALGKTMGLSVIAEGVETEGQRDFLSGIGCHAFQGFLFGRPMPLEEFERTLTAR